MVTKDRKKQAKKVEVEQEVSAKLRDLSDNIIQMVSQANERELTIIHRFLKNLLAK